VRTSSTRARPCRCLQLLVLIRPYSALPPTHLPTSCHPSPFTCITCRRFRVSVSVAMQQRHLQLATFPFVIARFRWGPQGSPRISLYSLVLFRSKLKSVFDVCLVNNLSNCTNFKKSVVIIIMHQLLTTAPENH